MTETKAKKGGTIKKEKAFHPLSRKAGQLERKMLRKQKLTDANVKRIRKDAAQVDKYVFFYHAIPPESAALSLEELHNLIRDVWLTRHDIELQQELAERRPGRTKSAKAMRLELIKSVEVEEYRSGLEVPDLTDVETVKLFRLWDEKEAPYIDVLRHIRISSADPTSVVVARPGKIEAMHGTQSAQSSETMDTEESR